MAESFHKLKSTQQRETHQEVSLGGVERMKSYEKDSRIISHHSFSGKCSSTLLQRKILLTLILIIILENITLHIDDPYRENNFLISGTKSKTNNYSKLYNCHSVRFESHESFTNNFNS